MHVCVFACMCVFMFVRVFVCVLVCVCGAAELVKFNRQVIHTSPHKLCRAHYHHVSEGMFLCTGGASSSVEFIQIMHVRNIISTSGHKTQLVPSVWNLHICKHAIAIT